jgi:DNA polymerase III epsilon subunit-like protein
MAPLSNQDVVLIAHNLPFDYKIASPYVTVVGEVCTLALARQYIRGSANHKLGTLREFFALPDLGAHRALGDVHTCLNVLRRILHDHGLTLDQVIKRQSKPRMLLTMPFGKFKDKPVADIPMDYRRWLLSAGNLDKDLRYTLEQLERI